MFSVVSSNMRNDRSSLILENPIPAESADRGMKRTSASRFCRLMPNGSVVMGVADVEGALSYETRWYIEDVLKSRYFVAWECFDTSAGFCPGGTGSRSPDADVRALFARNAEHENGPAFRVRVVIPIPAARLERPEAYDRFALHKASPMPDEERRCRFGR